MNKHTRSFPIARRMIVLSYLILTPVLIFISAVMTWYNYQVMLEEEQTRYSQETMNLCETVDTMMSSVMEMGTYIAINTEISAILAAEDGNALNTDSQLWVHNAPIQIFEDMLAINGSMKTLAIYPENGAVPYLRCIDQSAYLPTLEEVSETEMYQEAVKNGRVCLWQRVNKGRSETYLNSRGTKIVMYREIYDLSQKNRRGYIIIGSSSQRYDEVCENAAQTGGAVALVSGNGAVLCQNGELDSETIEEALALVAEDPGERISEGSAERKTYVNSVLHGVNVYSCQSEKTGLHVVRIIPNATASEMMISVFAGPLALLLGLLFGLYPVFRVTTDRVITQPLAKLTQAMRRFRKGDFSAQVEVIRDDEVGEASAGFNKMVRDMGRLIDENYGLALREKESELDVLQAQINPHFLYNALDSLYWRVMETGNEEAAEDILALSDLFRLELSRGEGIVTVQHEYELLERYLQIQKMRFEERMDYKLELDPAAAEARIPKLILQPFVENAIVHGFEKGREHFRLEVTGKKEDGMLEFRITDTGVGMTKEQIDKLFLEEDTRKVAGQRVGRFAIRNVKERLNIKYRGNYTLEITSEPGEGTEVLIRIPAETELI